MMPNPFGDSPVNAATNPFGDTPAPQRKISSPLQFAQKLAQGTTFGFGDEISAAMVGAAASLTGGNFRDGYDFALDKIRKDEEAFEARHPVLATSAEVAGAITGGAATGARLLGGGLRSASPIGRTARIAGVGAAEGGLYGAGTADEESRLGGAASGAAIGAIAAPIGTKIVDVLIDGGRGLASFASRKLADTPRSEAIRALRNAAIAEGIDADDAVRIIDELGPDATIADLGENFRFLARAATDEAGQFKTQARGLMNARQAGQQDRILQAAEVAAGQKAGNFNQARQALIQGRKAASKPLYERAFAGGVDQTETLAKLMKRPALKASLSKAKKMAADEGMDTSGNLLTKLHYAKMDLDDRIGAAKRKGQSNQVRILTGLKNELLAEIDAQNPAYREARELFSGDTRMLEAMDVGADMFRLGVDDLTESVNAMTPSERDLFKLGAVRAIKEKLDGTGETFDATKRLLNTKAMRDKFSLVFDDPDEFIKKALAEAEFSRTRSVLTGGSPTSERLAGQTALSGAIQPELISGLLARDPLAAASTLIKIFSKHKITPELVEELADVMLRQGQTPDDIRRIFTTPKLSQRLGSVYDQVVLPSIAGSLAPAREAAFE